MLNFGASKLRVGGPGPRGPLDPLVVMYLLKWPIPIQVFCSQVQHRILYYVTPLESRPVK